MAGIGGLLYEIEDGCQSGLYFCKDHLRPGCVKVVLVSKQGDGLLDEFAVIHGQRHLRDGVVGVGVCVVDLVVHHNRGVVAQFVRPHDLNVHLHGPGAHALGDTLHIVERIAAGIHEVIEGPSPVSVSKASVDCLVPNQGILIRWHGSFSI